MDKETGAQIHFQMESGKNQSDRMVQDCLDGLAAHLDSSYVTVGDNIGVMKIVNKEGRIMLDIKGLPGFDHIEFTIEKTGWGRDV